MKNRIISVLMLLLAVWGMAFAAHAHEVPDVTREDCSIEVIVQYDGENISGGTLTAVRVGEIAQTDGNYVFVRVKDGEPIVFEQSAASAEALRKFVEENQAGYDFDSYTVSVEEGKAKFSDLPTGLYLIMQDKAAEGYSALNAFLVSVPYLNDGVYEYTVTAAAKSSLAPELETEPTEPTDSTQPTQPDEPSDDLPQTGQLNWPVPLMAVAGLLLMTLGWMLRRKNGAE